MQRYYITDRKAAGGFRALLEIIRDQLEIGVDLVQIRENDVSGRAVFEFTMAVLEVRARIKGPTVTKILVSSRADIAKAAGADGVHLPAAAPVQTIPGLFVGRSCHTLGDLEKSAAQQANVVVFGPIFETPGKGAPLGIEVLQAAARLHPNLFALGGVTWENAEICIGAGAKGIAGIRLFQDPDL
jgi:thiamine-phosphate pyrophosphorylase